MGSQSAARTTALVLKLIVTSSGAIGISLALGYLYDETTAVTRTGNVQLGIVIAILATLAAAMSSTALMASLPESIRARFSRQPRKVTPKPVYGFTTVLAVGIGATIGSPLFILIPLNILQYQFVSLASLVLATVLSVAMAKVYAGMYTEATEKGLPAVGGPSFTQLATGTRSLRYFFSRVSMAIANTALAAYSQIFFVIFDLEILPGMLSSFGLDASVTHAVAYLIAIVFIGWSLLSALFEKRILRTAGYLQIVLTTSMVLILITQSILLGTKGSWNLAGVTQFSGGNWVFALIINTGYLYLLFFGFQEIQALERDAHDESKIPVLSWVKKGYTMRKSEYLGVAMVLTVIIAAAVNILYALSVYSLHPSLSALSSSQIPALYLANTFLGSTQGLLITVAFLIATVTTFVPAFVAASRHLSALGEDGYLPRSIANLSWVFTLVAILLLALGNANFLVEITDFLVLLSLGIITLSSVWMKSDSTRERRRILPMIVGGSCFVAGGAIYFIDSSVVIFGVLAVTFTYLIFDIAELGFLGTNLFLCMFSLVCAVLLSVFSVSTNLVGPALSFIGIQAGSAANILSYLLLLTSAMLALNLIVDVKVLGRTRPSA